MLSALEAPLESALVEPERLGMSRQVIAAELLLVREESTVHLPVLALIAGAVSRLGSLEGLLVNRLQREVADNVPQRAGLDVVSLDLRVRLTDVPGAERSLVIRELDERDLGVLAALRRAVADGQDGFGRGTGPGRGRGRTEQVLDLLELP